LYPSIFIGRSDNTTYGSGVIVRSEKVGDKYRNVFITCAHICTDSFIDYTVRQFVYENWSELKEVKEYPAVFSSVNHDMDLAMGMFYTNEEMPVAELEFDPKLYIGNEVFRIGCGLGDDPRLDYGKITAVKKEPRAVFRTSVMTVPGDSGSPLFHNKKVIAIVVSIRVDRNRNALVFNISYAIPLSQFRVWSDNYNHNLDYAWTKKEMPKLPFIYLDFKQYDIK
jgi:S1-C subfamily serine protease